MEKKRGGWDPVSKSRIRSWQRYERIKDKSTIIKINFKKTGNLNSVIKWLRDNIRNISPLKTKAYSTRWWLVYEDGTTKAIGFRNTDDALQFKLMGFHQEKIRYELEH